MAVVNAIDHPQGFGARKFVEGVEKKNCGKFFHTNWTGKGGTTSSSAYNV